MQNRRRSGKEVIIICLQIEIIFVRIDRILGKLSYVGESFLSVVGKEPIGGQIPGMNGTREL